MKSIAFALVVLGLAALGSAQTAARGILVGATSTSRNGNFTLMRGGVEFTIGAVRITADEADANMTTHEIELRGNVHLFPEGAAR